jgi:diaminopimelate decarboxylase
MKDEWLQKAADQYPTPSYLFDLDSFTERIRHIQKALPERVRLCYAMKANPFLAASAAAALDGLEVCSPGEYAICQKQRLTGKGITLSGVNKQKADILAVMQEDGAGRYTAESPAQLILLEECAAECRKTVSVLLRLSSGNQFGMDESAVRDAVKNRDRFPHLDFAGLQYYSGTQKKKIDRIQKELDRLDRLMTDTGSVFRELEYGPGFPIRYFEGEPEIPEDEFLAQFSRMLDGLSFSGPVTLEMGRFLAAPCGCYLTRIVDTKVNDGHGFAILDSGIHHINYYGQALAMKVPLHRFLPRTQTADGELFPWTLCGSLCTAGDLIAKELPLADAKPGDLIIFERIGAYSVTEGIYLFLSRNLPNILFYSEKEGLRCVREGFPTAPLNTF